MSAIVALLGGWRATAFAVIALAALAFADYTRQRLQHAQADYARQQLAMADAALVAERYARAIEAERAKRSAAIAESYEKGKSDAEVTAVRVVDDLRTGALRMRHQWAACETDRLSAATAAASQPDAAADDRASSAGRIVRAAAQADAQIAALQALVRADREVRR